MKKNLLYKNKKTCGTRIKEKNKIFDDFRFSLDYKKKNNEMKIKKNIEKGLILSIKNKRDETLWVGSEKLN